MPILNRNLEVGTRLVAKYKQQSVVCKVEAGESDEGVVYVLEDGKRFKSPSAAGSAVMGGNAVNGWRFWSIESEKVTESTEAEGKPPKSGKGKKTIYRNPNQQHLEEGKTRWFCVSCMKGFVVDGESEPEACPEGHTVEDLTSEPAVN